MNAPAEPGWNTARAICETTESVELGCACRWTARYETPRKSAVEGLGTIAIALLLGVSYLAVHLHAQPSATDSVVSQIAGAAFQPDSPVAVDRQSVVAASTAAT